MATEDRELLIQPGSLLLNDRDPDGDAFRLVAVGGAKDGAVEILANGNLRFMPRPDFFGRASFTYTVEDAKGARSTGTVLVDVANVNDKPVIVDFHELQSSGFDGRAFLRGGVTVRDPDGDPVTISLKNITGAVVRIETGFIIEIEGRSEAEVTFTVVAKDKFGATDTLNVALTLPFSQKEENDHDPPPPDAGTTAMAFALAQIQDGAASVLIQ